MKKPPRIDTLFWDVAAYVKDTSARIDVSNKSIREIMQILDEKWDQDPRIERINQKIYVVYRRRDRI